MAMKFPTEFEFSWALGDKLNNLSASDGQRDKGDVAENNHFTWFGPCSGRFYASAMGEMARHVGVCGSDVIKAIQKMESADKNS
jgi:hypothetical protein